MEPFKNVFSPALVSCFAVHLERHSSGFNRVAFEGPVLATLDDLELKARAQLIADHVHRVLPSDAATRTDILRAMLAPVPEAGEESVSDERGIGGWGVMSLSLVVGQHGIGTFETSLALLADMTRRFSSEFAVRYFLLADQERALETMREWVTDPDLNVRRLASEGTRPRLPWAMRLPRLVADPSPAMPLLEALRDDDHEYVRRSVANHLNDIAKDHPDRVAHLAHEWMVAASPERQRLVRHACRTLIKDGHPGALEVFGFSEPHVALGSFVIGNPELVFGESLRFEIELRSTSNVPQRLVVDYVIHFRKASGTLRPKVFKWKTFTLTPGEVRSDVRSHPIRKITTRRYYEGGHRLSLRINGRDLGDAGFVLHMPDAS